MRSEEKECALGAFERERVRSEFDAVGFAPAQKNTAEARLCPHGQRAYSASVIHFKHAALYLRHHDAEDDDGWSQVGDVVNGLVLELLAKVGKQSGDLLQLEGRRVLLNLPVRQHTLS